VGKILVTGATGFIGHEVARQLSAAGAWPRLLVRRPSRGGLLRGLDAEIMQGDLQSPASMRRIVEGVDAVIHLGVRATFEDYTLLKPSIVDGSVELMKAARESGVERFVYASSLLVYDSQEAPIDRDTPATSRLGYSRAKLEAEGRLGQIAKEAGLSFASVRLPHVYGARDLIFQQIRRGSVIQPGRGDNLYAHLHVEDAARLMIRIAETGWSGISAVGDERPATWREFYSVVREHYPALRVIRIPRWMALAGTSLLGLAARTRSRPLLYTPDAVRGANLRLPVRPGLLWESVGLRPKYASIWDGIPVVLDECVAFRWSHPLDDRGR